jgi:hypothetical protein
MKTYYQVCVGLSLTQGKPQLARLTLHSTPEYIPYIVCSGKTWLSHSRYFENLHNADIYIKYLFSTYPDSTVSYPVLDSNQKELFSEVLQ